MEGWGGVVEVAVERDSSPEVRGLHRPSLHYDPTAKSAAALFYSIVFKREKK